MDRDIALQIVQKITNINTALQGIVTGTTPVSDNRSLENAVKSEPVEPESVEPEPVEPETRNKK